LIYHPVCASKEGGLFLYGAATPLQEGKKLLADTSSSGLVSRLQQLVLEQQIVQFLLRYPGLFREYRKYLLP
jgi:hypothetical protein